MVKALIYFASTLMFLLAVAIIANVFVFSKSIASNCDDSGSNDSTEMRVNKPIVASVTIGSQVNEELSSKLISTAASTTTTTTKKSTTSTTTTIRTTPWWYLPRSNPTESDSSYESFDYSTEHAFWGSDSSSDSRTETSDDSGWGFDWGWGFDN